MKYYAVTDDPNELVHWGIKGMKWGIRRTDAQLGHPRHTGSKRPRSIAYKKAQAKLSASMRNGIQKVETKWKVYNSPANKQLRAEKRYNKQTERALQQARKGKLKYGKLDDWQVQRITDRLAMERDARALSETEKTWKKRLAESVGEGIIAGVGRGVSTRASEWIGRGSVLKTDRLRAEQKNYYDSLADERRLRNEVIKAKKVGEQAARIEDQKERLKRKREKEFEREDKQIENNEAKKQKRIESRNQKHLESNTNKQKRLTAKNDKKEYEKEYKEFERSVDERRRLREAAERDRQRLQYRADKEQERQRRLREQREKRVERQEEKKFNKQYKTFSRELDRKKRLEENARVQRNEDERNYRKNHYRRRSGGRRN